MRIESKLTGLDELKGVIQSSIKEAMVEAGEEAVQHAKETGDYQNQTGDLRSANGYSVLIDGEEVARNVPTSGHSEAKALTDKVLDKAKEDMTGLVLANGMPYGSFVEAKGFEVLSGAALHAESDLEKKTNH